MAVKYMMDVVLLLVVRTTCNSIILHFIYNLNRVVLIRHNYDFFGFSFPADNFLYSYKIAGFPFG